MQHRDRIPNGMHLLGMPVPDHDILIVLGVAALVVAGMYLILRIHG